MSTLSFFSFKPHRLLLLLGSILGTVVFIVLGNTGHLPLDAVSFLFFTFVLFLFSLYRLGWVFLLFIGVLPLENINIAPAFFGGLMLRPYQWLCGILLAAVLLRVVLRKLPFRLFQPRWFDLFPIFLLLGAGVAIVGAPIVGVAIKQTIVLASFVAVYFLGRIFFRTLYDVVQALPFFLGSSLVVMGYAVWQNARALFGQESFQVMVGRPNATFSEADWLGLFTILALGAGLAILTFLLDVFSESERERGGTISSWRYGSQVSLVGLALTLTFVVLLLSVARSAWLGAVALTEVFFIGILLSFGIKRIRLVWKKAANFALVVGISFFLACIIVKVFDLSPFQFWNRIQSTGSGLQKITISCYSADTILPKKISTLTELEQNGCRHIRLEDIVSERQAGRFIQEVFRPDPNVSIRQEIYGRVWRVIAEHPLLGIGWGSSAVFLGTDEQGTGLNASNMFLEVWLGSGLVGLIAFVVWWVLIMYGAVWGYRQSQNGAEWVFALCMCSVMTGVTVFNLFNSGVLLGFFFILLSLGAIVLERRWPLQILKP